MKKTIPVFVFCVAVGLVGCSSDNNQASDGGGDKDAVADVGGDGGVDTKSEQDATSQVDGEVAPVKLVRDKASCPAGYVEAAPKKGANGAFAVGGQQREFYLRPPAGAFKGPRPLLIYFHGTSGTGSSIMKFGFATKLTEAGFIVIGPSGTLNGTVWPTWDAMRQPNDRSRENLDLMFFDKIIDCVAAHHAIDERRVYIAGLSAGGIMVNRVLRERSKLLAGGIAASGIFDLTEPDDSDMAAGELGDMAVMVTWGGDNDEYSGSTGGVKIPTFNFVEQAALASTHYEDAEKVNQVYCRGANLGHGWLGVINELLVDFLVAHPKGSAFSGGWSLEEKPAPTVTCSEEAATAPSTVEVTCAAQTTAGCKSYCQTIGDCVVENDTLRPALGPQLVALGFSGAEQSECSGCVSHCETDVAAGGAVDTGLLACMETELPNPTDQCGAGIEGVLPFAAAVGKCCSGKQASKVCTRLCDTIQKNSAAIAFFEVCKSWN